MYRATHAGFNTSLDFCEGRRSPPSLASKFYSRVVVSQLGSFPPWTICHRVPDRLSHPRNPLTPWTLSGDSLRRISMRQRRGGAWGASKCIEIYEPTPPLPSPRAFESEAERLMPRFLGWISRWEREKCCDAILSSPVRESREIQSVHVRTLGNKRSLWMVRLISRERERKKERLLGYLESIFRNLIVWIREIGTRVIPLKIIVSWFSQFRMSNKSWDIFLLKFSHGPTDLKIGARF